MARPTLRYASRGDDVEYLQLVLAQLGYDVGPVDGIYGARTSAAVEEFQRARDLVSDGVVGPRTWAAIEEIAATEQSASFAPGTGGGGGGGCADESAADSHDTHGEGSVWPHVSVIVVGHTLMHVADVAKAGSIAWLAMDLLGVQSALIPFETEEEAQARWRQEQLEYGELWPHLYARIDSDERLPVFVAGCDADHNGTSWSGPYRMDQQAALDDLYEHMAQWPDHEYEAPGDADVVRTNDCRFVAGCNGDHNATSWSGPPRATYDEALYDLEEHLAQWPDCRIDPARTGATVYQL